MTLTFSAKQILLFTLSLILLITLTIVRAYNPSFTGGNPPLFGHSPDEVNVNISGTIKTLQHAINDADFTQLTAQSQPSQQLTARDTWNTLLNCPVGYVVTNISVLSDNVCTWCGYDVGPINEVRLTCRKVN